MLGFIFELAGKSARAITDTTINVVDSVVAEVTSIPDHIQKGYDEGFSVDGHESEYDKVMRERKDAITKDTPEFLKGA